MHKEFKLSCESNSSECLIYIGVDLFNDDLLINSLKSTKASTFAIITDTNVGPLFADKIVNLLSKHGMHCSIIQFPAGEQNKTRDTKEYCEDELLALNAGRDTCLIGLGGGVVTDVTGFIASTYCRGIPAIMIPTTLLAMVDASIGGKTGLNVPQGKNLIGTFYQPKAIFIDTNTLQSLPIAEIKNGMSEVIKHGLIDDESYFNYLLDNIEQIKSLDLYTIAELIYKSISIKSEIVQNDMTEKGLRHLLNFGHTIAHALEIVTKHEMPHGRAVAIGMLAESHISLQMGILKQSDFDLIREVIHAFQIDTTWKYTISPHELIEVMQRDKKSQRKIPRFVILETIGKPLEFNGEYCTSIDEKFIIEALNWMCTDVMHCN